MATVFGGPSQAETGCPSHLPPRGLSQGRGEGQLALGLNLDSAEKAHALSYAPRRPRGAHAVSLTHIRSHKILAGNRDSSMLDCGIFRVLFLIRVHLHELVEKVAGLEQ